MKPILENWRRFLVEQSSPIPKPNLKKKVLFIGDSIMAGISGKIKLNKKKYKVFKRAVSSARVNYSYTNKRGTKITSIYKQFSLNRSKRPNILVINGGINDAWTMCSRSPGWETAFRSFFDILEAASSQENIEKINKLYDSGDTIVYWTARGTGSGIDWESATKQQFEEWGVKYHDLKFGKPIYDLFIDDKNMNTGDWK